MCSGLAGRRSQRRRPTRFWPGRSGGGVMRRGPDAAITSGIWLASDLTATVKLEGVWKGYTRGMGALEKQAVKSAESTEGTFAHGRAYPQALPHRSQREGMDAARAVGARRQGRRATGALGTAGEPPCHLFRPGER